MSGNPATEIVKQAAFISGIRIHHFSTSDGGSADFAIEAENGAVVGIDVSFKSVLSERDFKNLQVMRAALGRNFNRGIIFTRARNRPALPDVRRAMPANAMWE